MKLRVYADMLPRLEAEAHLHLHKALVAAGDRVMEDRQRAEYLAELEHRALGERHLDRPETTADLASLGIAVREEKGADDGD